MCFAQLHHCPNKRLHFVASVLLSCDLSSLISLGLCRPLSDCGRNIRIWTLNHSRSFSYYCFFFFVISCLSLLLLPLLFLHFVMLKFQRMTRFLRGRCYKGELIPWIVFKEILPFCCTRNGAFFVGDMRRTLIIHGRTASLLNIFEITG